MGKNTQLEIFDYSGRKLDLSVCKEDIKVMKYIGDVTEELEIQSAMDLSDKGIDVFNPEDDFFNDICLQYDNSDGKDIILNDRRNEFYQDASFCEVGCIYKGINYNLKAANCICDSSLLQEEENNIENTDNEKNKEKFKNITKSFLTSLFDFNFDVLRCYNLGLNIKIYKTCKDRFYYRIKVNFFFIIFANICTIFIFIVNHCIWITNTISNH